MLEDSQVGITTILGSRYVGRIREKVEECDRKLNRLAETIDEWIACQRQWMYLDPPGDRYRYAPNLARDVPEEQ